MKILGRYYRSGNFWIVELPSIHYMGQGRSRKESLLMAKEGIEALVNLPDFNCEVMDFGDGDFALSTCNVKILAAFILRRIRESQGFSIRDVAKILKMKSHTEYARHESGQVAMTMETFNRYIEVISSKEVIIQIV